MVRKKNAQNKKKKSCSSTNKPGPSTSVADQLTRLSLKESDDPQLAYQKGSEMYQILNRATDQLKAKYDRIYMDHQKQVDEVIRVYNELQDEVVAIEKGLLMRLEAKPNVSFNGKSSVGTQTDDCGYEPLAGAPSCRYFSEDDDDCSSNTSTSTVDLSVTTLKVSLH